jgi:hypothetical protein
LSLISFSKPIICRQTDEGEGNDLQIIYLLQA